MQGMHDGNKSSFEATGSNAAAVRSVFGPNDIRGLYPEKWNRDTAYHIGLCLPDSIDGDRVVVGRDGRESSVEIRDALIQGLLERGMDVTDLGLVDTPIIYYAVGAHTFDAGIMVTASHNPPEYNGMKLTGRGAVPIDGQGGLGELADSVVLSLGSSGRHPTRFATRSTHPDNESASTQIARDYVQHLRSFRGPKPAGKAVYDCSSGAAGRFIHEILDDWLDNAVVVNDRVDGTFPVHGPNPSLAENLTQVQQLVVENDADVGFCFDGDGDRVVIIDEHGDVVSPDLVTAILGLYYFRHCPDAPPAETKVLVDVRSSNSVVEYLSGLGAVPVRCPTGHAKVKRQMREANALFGGELTGHYYFKEHFFCDSPWITIFRVLSVLEAGGITLSELRGEIMKYHFSGEINFVVENPDAVIDQIHAAYADAQIGRLDGLRFDYPDWWFIIREASTESYLRVVVEARNEKELQERVADITERIQSAAKIH